MADPLISREILASGLLRGFLMLIDSGRTVICRVREIRKQRNSKKGAN